MYEDLMSGIARFCTHELSVSEYVPMRWQLALGTALGGADEASPETWCGGGSAMK